MMKPDYSSISKDFNYYFGRQWRFSPYGIPLVFLQMTDTDGSRLNKIAVYMGQGSLSAGPPGPGRLC